MDEKKKQRFPTGGPQLVSERSSKQVEDFKKLQRVMNGEFMSGTFQNVLASRTFLLRDLEVEGSTDFEAAATHARSLIPEVLRNNERVIKVSDLPVQELIHISQSINVNLAVEQWLKSEGLELADVPNLSDQNIKKHVTDFRNLIWGLVGTLSLREELEDFLKRRGVNTRNQDTTRLLIYELNKDQLVPHVLVLPNDYKPHNPYIVMLIHDAKLPVEVMRLLRCFNR